MSKETLKDWTGKVLGYVTTSPSGDKTLTDFYGKILGRYIKHRDVTVDFYGAQVGKGDLLLTLLK